VVGFIKCLFPSPFNYVQYNCNTLNTLSGVAFRLAIFWLEILKSPFHLVELDQRKDDCDSSVGRDVEGCGLGTIIVTIAFSVSINIRT
jgi:hypothetical protein